MELRTTKLKSIVKIIVLIAGYAFLLYKLIPFFLEDFNPYFKINSLNTSDIWLCIALMPANLLLEIWHWKFSLSPIHNISIFRSAKSVFGATIAGLITPAKVGEWPGRALMLPELNFATTTTVAAYAGIIKTLALCISGTLAFIVLKIYGGISAASLSVSTPAAVVIVILILIFFFSRRFISGSVKLIPGKQKYLTLSVQWLTVAYRSKSLILALLRSAVFFIQFYLAVSYLGIELQGFSALMIPVYFMALTILPVITIAEPGIRGSLAILMFGSVIQNSEIVGIAAVLLWMINNFFPLVLGSVFCIRKR